MDTEEYIRSEVERQHSTKFEEFRTALHYARIGPAFGIDDLLGTPKVETFKNFVMNIAELVEPEVNALTMESALKGGGNLRQSHVGFYGGGSAAPAGEVEGRFHRWASVWTEGIIVPKTTPTREEVIWAVKSLLEIHPWADGNGRTASILRNWMLGTLENPTPLPRFFGNS